MFKAYVFLSDLSRKKMEIKNDPIASNKIKAVIKNLWKAKTQETEIFTGEFHQTFREELMPTIWKTFHKISEAVSLSDSLYRPPSPSYHTHTHTHTHAIVIKEKENYRPILLKNIDGKVFNKALANRIQQCIKNFIHHDQVGFIPGMQEFFNICKWNNVIHHLTNRKIKTIWESQ